MIQAVSEMDHHASETLVYADVGQMTLKKPSVSLFDLDYHRTEYATIKHQPDRFESLDGNERSMVHDHGQLEGNKECNNPGT